MTRLIQMAIVVLFASTAMGQDIVAHRGASHDAPENTLASFKEAWAQNAEGIEGDFYLTKDGHIVCIHDRMTERVSGVNLNVSNSTLKELQQLDVGSWKDETFAGERIPTLEQVLAEVGPKQYILLEIKSGPETVPVLRRVLENAGLEPWQTKVIAFNPEVVAQTRKLIPDIDVHWLTSYRRDEQTGQWSPTIDEILQTLDRIDAHGLDTNGNRQVVDEAFVAALRKAGYELHVWTVNRPEDALYFQSLGVDSITTDRPALLREALALPAPAWKRNGEDD